jgi:hypothetical protein
MDVASLQSALTNQLSAMSITETLDLAAREPRPAVSMLDASEAAAGSPVVENGRLVGVIAEDLPERPEPTEVDLSRGAADDRRGSDDSPDSGRKRGLWQRLSRSQ